MHFRTIMEDSAVQTLDLQGKTMEYLRFGKEGGEIFVILPGLSLKSVLGSAEAIESAYALIAEDHDVFLFDHIKEEPSGYTIEDMAVDTLAAFKSLGIEKAKIMGVSMGGMVAQALALKDPGAVDCLILCSTASNTGDVSILDGWKELAEKKDAKALSKAFGEYVYTPSFYEQYRDVIDNLGEGASDLDFANFIISIEAIKKFDARESIKSVSCHAFVMGAEEDRVLGVQGSYDIMDSLGCEGYVYKDKGHGVYDEAQDYLKRIRTFLLTT